jgi:hypothetical protein
MQATEAMEKPTAARKKDLSSGELDALREIKNEAKVVKSLGAFWLPLIVALGIALGGGVLGLLGWMGKRALMAEFDVAIKKAMQPMTRDVGEIRKGQIEMGRKVDRMEIQQTYQAEQIREIKKRLEKSE